MFLNCSCFSSFSCHGKNVSYPNRVLPAAGCKLSVLKHSFAQEIIVTLMQHSVVFFSKNLQLHLYLLFLFIGLSHGTHEAEPQMILACS